MSRVTDLVLGHDGAADNATWLSAAGYRCLYFAFGGTLAARLAPDYPIGHALALGVLWLAMGLSGLFFPHTPFPAWYAIAVGVEAVPFAWLGGWMVVRRQRRGRIFS
ncbi:MAG TPA: hypothetical protein VGG48_10705 [Rhizomicrobium sp.]